MPLTRFLKAAFGAVLLSGTTLLSHAEEQPVIDPEAQQLLKGMSDYLATLKQFTVSGEATREEVFGSGQKLMFHNQYQLAVRRPDKLHLARRSADKDKEIFYDGEHVTLFGKNSQTYVYGGGYVALLGKNGQVYATAEAPPTLDETLDYAADVLDLPVSGRDLIYQDAYAGLMSDVESGSIIGQSIVDGVLCNHLVFRADDVDWQIWIEDGDRPLPRKYVITSRWITGAPQYVLRLKEWDLSPDLPDARFHFKAPENASKIRFLSIRSKSATNDK